MTGSPERFGLLTAWAEQVGLFYISNLYTNLLKKIRSITINKFTLNFCNIIFEVLKCKITIHNDEKVPGILCRQNKI